MSRFATLLYLDPMDDAAQLSRHEMQATAAETKGNTMLSGTSQEKLTVKEAPSQILLSMSRSCSSNKNMCRGAVNQEASGVIYLALLSREASALRNLGNMLRWVSWTIYVLHNAGSCSSGNCSTPGHSARAAVDRQPAACFLEAISIHSDPLI